MDAALKDKFDQILKFDENERFEDENQVIPYLRIVTSYRYTLNISSHRRWGNQNTSTLEEGQFCQIVPDRVDNGFFDWYCDQRPDHQFFKTIEMALLHFMFYWQVWRNKSQGNSNDNEE